MLKKQAVLDWANRELAEHTGDGYRAAIKWLIVNVENGVLDYWEKGAEQDG